MTIGKSLHAAELFGHEKSLHRKMMYLRLMYDYMDVNLLSILDHLVKLRETEIIMHVAFCILVLFNPSNGKKNTAIEDVLYTS